MIRFPALLALLSLLGACRSPEPWASAAVIGDLSEAIGGPKASAQPGDFLLENDRIRVAILGARPSMGPGLYGGSIVDADLQRGDQRYAHGLGNDLFAELIPTVNMNIPGVEEEGDVEILADGSDGGAAIVRVTAPEAPFFSLMNLLWAALGVPDQVYQTDYILEPGASWVRIRTTVTWGGDEVLSEGEVIPAADEDMPLLEYALESGLVMGDFFLPGGSVDVFAPGIGFDEEMAVVEAYESGRNLFLDPITVPFLAAAGDGTSYAYGAADPEGVIRIPLFTSNLTFSATHGTGGDGSNDRFPEGSAFEAERIFAVGDGDVGSALDALLEARGVAVGRLDGLVLEDGTWEPVSDAHVFAFMGTGSAREPYPWTQWGTDPGLDSRADGSFGGSLPPGSWTLMAHSAATGSGTPVEIELSEGQEISVALDLPRPGRLRVQVVDQDGRAVPAKLSLFAADGENPRRSALGDGYMAGDVAAVHHGTGEAFVMEVPAGSYWAVASRGPEYEIHSSEPFDLDGREELRIELRVDRVVDSQGFIAADFHVHSDTSFDSGTSSELRVRSMVSEGVEFFPSTDHDHLTDHAPTVEALGLEPWVRTVVGVEVSPVEMGHFLGSFMRHDTIAEAGGAFEWTGMEPEEIIEGIRALGDPDIEGQPLVAVAHPRDGILGLFDQYGLDPYADDDGDPELSTPPQNLANELLHADRFTLDFDMLELFNAKRFELIRSPTQSESDALEAGEDPSAYRIIGRTMEEQEALEDGSEQLAYGIKGQVDDWFTLLNLGYRHTAVGNSDTHNPTKTESGCPRSWVLVEVDDPWAIDPAAMAQAIREHRVVASYGPFLRFEADGQPIGSEIQADGAVELSIEVQSPSWFDVDRVELYENGTLIREWEIATPNSEVVNLLETVSVEPDLDSWYVVIALGDSEMWPVFVGQERPYITLQNMIMEAVSQVGTLAQYLPDAIPRIDRFPMVPYALTNPIWVDVDGDGWDAPGLPAWLSEPEDPGAAED
jgi:hypothetical protein